MKAEGHPKVSLCEVSCTCGNKFHIMFKKPTLTVDICSGCHPFYTGTQKFVDSAGRVDAFTKRFSWDQDKAKVKATQKLDFKKQQGPQEDLKTALERKRLFSAKREIPIPTEEKEERGGRGFGGRGGGGRGRGRGKSEGGEGKAEAKPAKAEAKSEAKPENKG
jgi:large subunit ribosomal protein L31